MSVSLLIAKCTGKHTVSHKFVSLVKNLGNLPNVYSLHKSYIRPSKKTSMFQVTLNFKIGAVGRKIFLLCLKFLYEVNRKTIWPNGEIPTKSLKKTSGPVVKNKARSGNLKHIFILDLAAVQYTCGNTLFSVRRPQWLSWMRCPTGDQEVAGSTPAEVGNILSWRLIMKYFLRSFSLFC